MNPMSSPLTAAILAVVAAGSPVGAVLAEVSQPHPNETQRIQNLAALADTTPCKEDAEAVQLLALIQAHSLRVLNMPARNAKISQRIARRTR